MRSWLNRGLIRPLTSRSDDAHASSVASTVPPAITAPMITESWGPSESEPARTATVMLGPGLDQHQNAMTAASATAEAKLAASLS
jgi:NAD(P)H-hydrate repair Nnr-like enzyme with NAD(P)H-hydrate dehydratase domain